MTLKCLSLVLGLALARPVNAADLSDVDRYLGAPDWAAASTPRLVSAQFTECTSFSGCADPMLVTFDVQPKSSDILEITTLNKDGRPTNRQQLERSRYETALGNWVRMNLESIGSYGYSTQILSVSEDTFPVRWRGQDFVLPVLKVVAEARNQLGDVQNLTYLISQDIKGYGAVLYYVQRQSKPMNVIRTTTVKEIRE